MRNNYSKFLNAIFGSGFAALSDEDIEVEPILEKEMDSFNDMCIFNKSPRRANPSNEIYPKQEVDLMADMGIDKKY